MLKPTRLLALGLIAALLIAAAVWGAARLLYDPVDDCLDAGGSWHYDVEECSFTETYSSASASQDDTTRHAQFLTQSRLATLRETGLSEAEIQDRLDRCGADRDASFQQCDDALRTAPNDPETVDLHPYCRGLTVTEYDECLFSE